MWVHRLHLIDLSDDGQCGHRFVVQILWGATDLLFEELDDLGDDGGGEWEISLVEEPFDAVLVHTII